MFYRSFQLKFEILSELPIGIRLVDVLSELPIKIPLVDVLSELLIGIPLVDVLSELPLVYAVHTSQLNMLRASFPRWISAMTF